MIAGGAFGIVLVVVAIILVINSHRINLAGSPAGKPSVPATSAAPPSPHKSSAPPRNDRAAVVSGYLNALAAGNAKQALSYLAETPHDKSLLTSAVLKRSAKSARITKIKTGTPSASGSVPVSYQVGRKKISTSFTITGPAGKYRISDGTSTIDLASQSKGLDLLINGAKVKDASKITVFAPGVYKITLGLKYIELSGSPSLLVTKPDAQPDPTLTPKLTTEGQQAFREAVQSAVNACISSTKRNGGCGLNTTKKVRDGRPIAEGSVKRTTTEAVAESVDSVTGHLDPDNPTQASASLGHPKIKCTAVVGGYRVKVYGGSVDTLWNPTIDMTDPHLQVYWQWN